jgi:aerotaxis receptor
MNGALLANKELLMRNNQPVTQKEQDFSADVRIISMTDLQGDITFVNRDFIQLSGFTE